MRKDKEWLRQEVLGIVTNYPGKVYIYRVIELINQLDEPELPVVPQFVANYIEENRKTSERPDYIIFTAYADFFERIFKDERMYKYIQEQNEFAKSVLNGYEVEKEKLYRVKISKDLYFAGFEELKIKFVKDDAPGAIEQAKLFRSKDEALKAIEIIGIGIVEEVTE